MIVPIPDRLRQLINAVKCFRMESSNMGWVKLILASGVSPTELYHAPGRQTVVISSFLPDPVIEIMKLAFLADLSVYSSMRVAVEPLDPGVAMMLLIRLESLGFKVTGQGIVHWLIEAGYRMKDIEDALKILALIDSPRVNHDVVGQALWITSQQLRPTFLM